MTRYVTLTIQVRPHAEQIEVDGRQFTDPALLWAYLHGGASELARKPAKLGRSLFINEEQAREWQAAMAQGGFVYDTPPGGVAITRIPAGRGVDTSNQEIKGKSLADLGL